MHAWYKSRRIISNLASNQLLLFYMLMGMGSCLGIVLCIFRIGDPYITYGHTRSTYAWKTYTSENAEICTESSIITILIIWENLGYYPKYAGVRKFQKWASFSHQTCFLRLKSTHHIQKHSLIHIPNCFKSMHPL